MVVKDGGFDPTVGAELRRLFELRNAADYAWLDTPHESADGPIAAAERFIDAIERWIDDQ